MMTSKDRDRKTTRARDLRQKIDENLRRVYREVLDEEVPERFRALLEELQRKTDER